MNTHSENEKILLEFIESEPDLKYLNERYNSFLKIFASLSGRISTNSLEAFAKFGHELAKDISDQTQQKIEIKRQELSN